MSDSVKDFLNYASYEEDVVVNQIANTDEKMLKEALLNRRDVILFGPPGTSKTYMIDHLKDTLPKKNLGKLEIIQFHANYSYEEFIEGIVPDVEKGGFKIEPGAFVKFCDEAKKIEKTNSQKLCIFVIDEINRANVTAVFGEVLNLMENKGERVMKLPKLQREFVIPKNVVILGTMNTADKTLAKIDFAFRRRFRFLPVFPSKTTLHQMVSQYGFAKDVPITVDEYVKCFEVLNAKINKHVLLGKNLMLGHVLWTRKDIKTTPYTKSDIGRIFRETILPQLESYCGSNKDVLGNLLNPTLRDKILYGYEISDDEIMNYLCVIKKSKVVNS